MKRRLTWGLVAVAGAVLSLASLYKVPSVKAAVTAVYANNATGGAPYIYIMTPGTLGVTRTLQNLSSSNGRGVVVVNNTLYYTAASSNAIYSYNLSTNTNNGSVFTVAGTSALSTIAFDGTNFWIGDYGGSGKAYSYSITGTLLKTVTLANCGSNCDGLEYFLSGTNSRLISNRGDAVGPYDIYDTNGTLLTPAFITTTFSPTGIAFDGTNFLVSDLNHAAIATYNGTTGAFINSTSITGFPSGVTPLVEDLSVDYSQVLGPGTTTVTVPVMSTPILLVCALLMLGLGLTMMQKRTQA